MIMHYWLRQQLRLIVWLGGANALGLTSLGTCCSLGIEAARGEKLGLRSMGDLGQILGAALVANLTGAGNGGGKGGRPRGGTLVVFALPK